MKSLFTFLFITTFALSSFAQRDFSKVEVKPTKVKGNIYMLTGSGGNIGVITGDDGIFMVDNQFAPLADKIRAAIKSIGGDKVTYMINTHFHGDHSGGNTEFGEEGAMIVAHENVRTRLSTETKRKNGETLAPSPEVAWPILTFKESIRFHLNGENIELIHKASAHTDGDIVVYFHNANVIHMGDIFVTYGFPYLDANNGASITGMIDFLTQIIDVIDDETIVIPGHGPISKKTDIIAFRDRLQDIFDIVMIQKRKGKTVDEMIEAKILEKYDGEWGGGFIKVDDFILLLNQSLEGK